VLALAAKGSANAALTADERVLNWGDLYSFYGKTNIPADLSALSLPVMTNSRCECGCAR